MRVSIGISVLQILLIVFMRNEDDAEWALEFRFHGIVF